MKIICHAKNKIMKKHLTSNDWSETRKHEPRRINFHRGTEEVDNYYRR